MITKIGFQKGCWGKVLVIVAVLSFVFASDAASKKTIRIGSYDNVLELTMNKTNGLFTSTNIKAQMFKQVLEKKSRGEFEVKIFPNGQLGSDEEALDLLRSGNIVASAYPIAVITNIVPEVNCLHIPFLFRDFHVFNRVMNGPFGKELNEVILKKSGIRMLDWKVEGPYFNFMAVNKPIHKPEDVKGMKIRVPGYPVLVEMVKHLGGSPTPIPYAELYSSLQQGVIDGVVTAFTYLQTAKLDEVLRFYNRSDVMIHFSNFGVNEKFWQTLSEDERFLVKSAALSGMTSFQGMLIWGEDLHVQDLLAKGDEVYESTSDERKVWKNSLYDHMVEWIKGKAGAEWVEKVIKAATQAEQELYGIQ